MFKKTALVALLLSIALASGVIASHSVQVPNGRHALACAGGQPITLEPPSAYNCPLTTTPAAPPTPSTTPTISPPTVTPIPVFGFVETFDGLPAAPAPWRPANWDLAVHSRDRETWIFLNSMAAQHGPDCDPPPENHVINTYEEAVFICRDHMMTGINSGGGYAAIYLTPNQMVNFWEGEAVIRFDVSTLRTSGRDWWDIWITPYSENLALPLEDWLPDLNGEPRRAIHIRMKFGTPGNLSGNFEGFIINGFDDTVIPLRRTAGYESIIGFTPSATQRSTFELRLSQTHVKFGMPTQGIWWIDSDIPPLGWGQGIVQIGHHSYNPMKQCATCSPNTYHWDNFSISPASPFTILPADRRFVDTTPAGKAGTPLVFTAPAPAGSHLRFSGIGNNIEVSYDGGATWRPAQLQAQEEYHDENFRTYWTPIPAGTWEVLIRGRAWWGDRWHVRGISIWSRAAPPE